jgi:hypothetical protein
MLSSSIILARKSWPFTDAGCGISNDQFSISIECQMTEFQIGKTFVNGVFDIEKLRHSLPPPLAGSRCGGRNWDLPACR